MYKKISIVTLAVILVAVTAFIARGIITSSALSESPADRAPKVAVDASVYRGLMEMLGIRDRCIDFSDQMNPSPEQIMASGADMLMLSVYDGMDVEKYHRTGLRIIECHDFNETTPLSRAQWMVYYGDLWGVKDRADSLYHSVVESYRDLLHQISDHADSRRPSVFFDIMYSGLWYQPVERSTTGQIVLDACGTLTIKSDQKGGAVPLSKEEMLMNAAEADLWIIRYMSDHDMTLQELQALNPLYAEFRAFREGNVWGVNTSMVPYYDETPFRPDWLLADIAKILHPEIFTDAGMRYFKKLQ